MTLRRQIGLWLPVLALLGLLFYLSSMPRLPLAAGAWDKAVHFGAYGILALLWLRALHGGLGPLRAAPTVAAWMLTVLYGAIDEFHQSFVPGRQASGWDLLADAAGATVAAAALGAWMAFRGRRRRDDRIPEIVLFETEGCHRCHDARLAIEKVGEEVPFRFVRRLAEEAGAEGAAVRAEVPVVFLDGQKLFEHHVDPGRLRRALRARQRTGGV